MPPVLRHEPDPVAAPAVAALPQRAIERKPTDGSQVEHLQLPPNWRARFRHTAARVRRRMRNGRATASRPPATAAWLARFADAMQFVPDGMSSHWFSDHRDVPLPGGLDVPRIRQVVCGRNFEPPRNVGAGHYEGVTIEDWGDLRVPAERGPEFLEPQPAIDGVDVWAYRLISPSLEDVPARAAIVDARFVVIATSEALLREALRRTGAPRFGSLEPLPAIDDATIDLVVRDLAAVPPRVEPAMGVFAMTNVPGVSAIAAVTSSPLRVRIWGRDDRELAALTRFCFQVAFTLEPAVRAGEYWSTSAIAATDDAHLDLRLALFFGLWIFV